MLQKKISLSFDSSWVLSKRDEEVLPVEAFLTALKEVLSVDVLHSSLTDCEAVVNDEELDCDAIDAIILEILWHLLLTIKCKYGTI